MLARALLLLTFSCGLSAVPEFSTLSDSAAFRILPTEDELESSVLPMLTFVSPDPGIVMAFESEVCWRTRLLHSRARSNTIVLRLQLSMSVAVRKPRSPYAVSTVAWEIAGRQIASSFRGLSRIRGFPLWQAYE